MAWKQRTAARCADPNGTLLDGADRPGRPPRRPTKAFRFDKGIFTQPVKPIRETAVYSVGPDSLSRFPTYAYKTTAGKSCIYCTYANTRGGGTVTPGPCRSFLPRCLCFSG